MSVSTSAERVGWGCASMPGSACRRFSAIVMSKPPESSSRRGSEPSGEFPPKHASPQGESCDGLLEDFGKAVDVGFGALFRDGHEQAVAFEWMTGVDAAGGAELDHVVDVGVQLERELAHDGLVVPQLDAVERAQRLARVVRAGDEQLAELDDPLAAEPAEVDHPGERVER